jgi:hypothetical protein
MVEPVVEPGLDMADPRRPEAAEMEGCR